jgi:shikimate dehydrogenase
VISLGGGIVTRQENLDLLRQNSLIVYLKRSLKDLATDGRPLSQKMGVEALAKQRLPLYETWSDMSFPVQESPVKTALGFLDLYKKL